MRVLSIVSGMAATIWADFRYGLSHPKPEPVPVSVEPQKANHYVLGGFVLSAGIGTFVYFYLKKSKVSLPGLTTENIQEISKRSPNLYVAVGIIAGVVI